MGLAKNIERSIKELQLFLIIETQFRVDLQGAETTQCGQIWFIPEREHAGYYYHHQ